MAGIVLGSNISALTAIRRVAEATDLSLRNMERLSSGQRINRASDDAAGLAIASSLNANARVFGQALRNINDGLSLLNIAEGTLGSLSDVVIRMRELSQQAANGSLSAAQRKSLDSEAQILAGEYFRISRGARFNGLGLFDGSLANGLRIQAGFQLDGSIQSTLGGSLGTGTFAGNTTYLASPGYGGYSEGIALGDINNDGKVDMVSAGRDGTSGLIAIQLGNGNGTFGAAISYTAESNRTYGVTLRDIDEDGILDVASVGIGDDNLAYTTVRLGNGDGTFADAVSYQSGTDLRVVRFADLDGDGILDMASGGQNGGAAIITIRRGLGNGDFGSATTYTPQAGIITDLRLQDINSDGKVDLLTTGYDGGTGRATVNFGLGNGAFSTSTFQYVAESQLSHAMTLGDVNSDGILDLITAGSGDDNIGYATIRLGSSNGTFGAATSYQMHGSEAYSIQFADVNGDGHGDLVSGGIGAGQGYTAVRLGSGNGTFANVTTYQVRTSSVTSVAVADVNGDGVLDILSNGNNGGQGVNGVQLGQTRDGINPLLSFSLLTKADALQSMQLFNTALDNLSKQRGVIGAFQSRLMTAYSNMTSMRENSMAAASRITDIDLAAEAAQRVRLSILSQVSASVLAQANQAPALALLLLT